MPESVANSLGVSYAVLKFIIDSVLLNLFMIMFCVLEYRIAMKFINNKFSSSLGSAFTYTATASYCIYLFHRPFLALWNSITTFISNPVLHDVVIIFVALPLLLFTSYHLQVFELNLKKFFSRECTPGKKSSSKGSTDGSSKWGLIEGTCKKIEIQKFGTEIYKKEDR